MADTTPESNLLGQFIPLHYHYQMLLDQARMKGFHDAIQHILPDKGKAVELGGGTGVLSFFAAKKASKVWCVERNPEMVEAAKRYLKLNNAADRVEVIEGDAAAYVPPEPVDIVICEMLHSALLREKQLQIIDSFKKNYFAKFPGTTLRFIPEATILAAQPVEQDYQFEGYFAPVPMFVEPTREQPGTVGLADPAGYSLFEYRGQIPMQFSFEHCFTINRTGTCNAIRFITKNVLAVLLEQKTTVDWHNFYLMLPLKQSLNVREGQQIQVKFSYAAGAPLQDLMQSLEAVIL